MAKTSKSSASAAASSSSVDTTSKRTPGEELYLVHLSRCENEEPRVEDYDFDTIKLPRQRAESAGEELWKVHCKRSAGVEPDYDEEEDDDEKKTRAKKAGTGRRQQGVAKTPQKSKEVVHKKKTRVSPRSIIHLRNRNVRVRTTVY